ncbi:MAG: DciA family protein [Steroidobacteraceae bacterium]
MSDPLKPLFGGPGGALEQLAKRASAVDALAGLVRRELPPPLGEHVTTASRRGEDLVVTVDSAAWAARVRYAGPGLRTRLAAAGQPVEGKVRVRVGRTAG